MLCYNKERQTTGDIMRINEYAPNITTGEDGFTVLAHSEEMATKEILTYINADEFDRIDLKSLKCY